MLHLEHEVTVQQLLDEKEKEWELKLVAGRQGLSRKITTWELCRPGLLFAGHKKHFASKRIQIIGMAEWSFIESMSPEQRRSAVERLFSYEIPAVIISKNLEPPEPMKELADRTGIPLIVSGKITTELEHLLVDHLWRKLAHWETRHGTFVDVFGVGVFLTGKSKMGKSECALDLVSRGHALVADDVVKFIEYPKGRILGMSAVPEELDKFKSLIEVRGFGLVDVCKLFGVKAFREEKRLDVIVEFVKSEDHENEHVENKEGNLFGYRRLGIAQEFENVMGVKIKKVKIHVSLGKNLATLVEIIALNHILEQRGYNAAAEFENALIKAMKHAESK